MLFVLGSVFLYQWSPAPTRRASTSHSSPALQAVGMPSPPRQESANPGNQRDRSGTSAPGQPRAGSPVRTSPPPTTWEEAKVQVERVRTRLQNEERTAAVALYSKTRKQPSGSGTASAGAEGEADSNAVLPPVIVPFDPQHPSLPAALPAVLADFPAGGGITPEQQAGVDQLAEDFLEAVADPLADPTDPVYQKRWQQAQLTADQLFRLRYGDFAWMLRHNAAHRQALGDNTGQ